VIREACDRGVVIVNITQCARGTVELVYALGYTLTAAGVVGGLDMSVRPLSLDAASSLTP
jgi:L-asparaginase/Glu-tRNA(Gln) amidotransferase subunit D